MMERIVLLSFAVYAVTFVVTASSLFEGARLRVMKNTPWLKIGSHKHFVECRMCVGFWVSLLACNIDYRLVLPVYGLSYFMATQER